jgi:hypothetical protein
MHRLFSRSLRVSRTADLSDCFRITQESESGGTASEPNLSMLARPAVQTPAERQLN